MLISNILEEMKFSGRYKIMSEKPFDYLALTESTIRQSNCVYVEDEKYIDSVKGSVTMVLTKEKLMPCFMDKPVGLCVVDYPRSLFFDIHNYLSDKEYYVRRNFKSTIGENCAISKMSSIAENSVRIGNNVVIEEFVVIRENTSIGDNTVIRAGCIIGGQGYEFKRKDVGVMGVFHAGGVRIGKHVEIQYNTCVDKGVYPWDDTVVGDYCKIDNLVHIAHGVKLDKGVMVVANAGIGGRTTVGEKTWIGLAATVSNGITVGGKARANIGSVVTRSVPDRGSVTGNFAIEHSKFISNLKKSIKEV